VREGRPQLGEKGGKESEQRGKESERVRVNGGDNTKMEGKIGESRKGRKARAGHGERVRDREEQNEREQKE
jgi:hypothetical protein